MTFLDSELILTDEGRIYHINLKPEDLGDTVFTVGDPDRVDRVSRYFDEVSFKTQHREFVTHTGTYNGHSVSVISTGIGTPNIDIVMNELNAVANIDFATRELKTSHKTLRIVRLGTAGGLHEKARAGTIGVTSRSIGLSGLLHYYQRNNIQDELALAKSFSDFYHHSLPVPPYAAFADNTIVNSLSSLGTSGITVTCPGFYAPQDRNIGGTPRLKDFMQNLLEFSYQGEHVLNFEMETAAILGLGEVFNHQCCSVSAIIANRRTGEFHPDPQAVVDEMIKNTLQTLLS